jgi:hypothetical protein
MWTCTDKKGGIMQDPTQHLFVVETPYDWTVWQIIDVTPEQVNPALNGHIVPTRDGQYIWPKAEHFWTFDCAKQFMNQTVTYYESVDIVTEVTFL